MSYSPEEDGITHINVYSKGLTELGKFLSNFARQKFECDDGSFESIEGYWYWLGSDHSDKDKLRNLYGWKAKEFGREIKSLDWQDSEEFKEKIRKAITIKLNNNPTMLQSLKQNKLPLAHYYNYGGKVVEVKNGEWILDHIRSIGEEL